MTPTETTSVIAFILNSALFSSFIIPQVQKLKEIKDRLFKFELTSARLEFMAGKTEVPKEEIHQLQEVLDIYRVRAGELDSLIHKFYGSVGLAILTLVASAVWPAQKDRFLTVHPILQLILLIWAIKSYTTDPDKLSSPLYLVKECDVNPQLLIQAIEFNLSFGPETGLSPKQGWETPFSVTLSMKLRLSDFRFLFFIADDEGKVFYTSFGPVTYKTRFWRYLAQPASRIPEINLLEIGKFNFNKFSMEKSLRWTFLLFVPIFRQEKLHPMIMTGNISVPGKASGTMMAGIWGGSATAGPDRTYQGISYTGEGEKLFSLEVESVRGENPVVSKIAHKLRNDIIRARKIESITDFNGLIAAD